MPKSFATAAKRWLVDLDLVRKRHIFKRRTIRAGTKQTTAGGRPVATQADAYQRQSAAVADSAARAGGDAVLNAHIIKCCSFTKFIENCGRGICLTAGHSRASVNVPLF